MNKKQQEKEDHENLVTVFETGNEAIAEVVKSILDEAKIRYLSQDEGIGVGVLGTDLNPLTGPVIFQVMPEDAENARELLKDVKED
jgi:Putative prokaryotic signal transducing protein